MFRLRTVALPKIRGVRFNSTEPPVMASVRESLKAAMRARDDSKKAACRGLMSAVKSLNQDKPGSVTTDIGVYSTIQSIINKKQSAIEDYKSGDRQDLVDKEQKEVNALNDIANQISVANDEEIAEHIKTLTESKNIKLEQSQMKAIMAAVPWKAVETEWNAPSKNVAAVIKRLTTRSFSTSARRMHENPLVRRY